MSTEPHADEYQREDKAIRHKPTGIRITLDFQNEKGEWTVGYMEGKLGEYEQDAVVKMGADLLIAERQFAERIKSNEDLKAYQAEMKRKAH